MANHQSAIRKHRRDLKRRMINRMNIAKMRNRVKTLRKKVQAGENEASKTLFPQTIAVIDKTIRKGTIHWKTGARYKSRIFALLRKSGIGL